MRTEEIFGRFVKAKWVINEVSVVDVILERDNVTWPRTSLQIIHIFVFLSYLGKKHSASKET